MNAIDVLISLLLVVLLAYVTVLVIKYLEDAGLLTINKYMATGSTVIIWWLFVASILLLVAMQRLNTGQPALPTDFNYWSIAAITLTYCLAFYLMLTGRKKTKSQKKKSK